MILETATTAGTFFYIGWWLGHEHFEIVPEAHDHVFGPHYWKLAIPLVLAWTLTTFPSLWTRPIALLTTCAAIVLLCASQMEIHPTGVPYTASLTGVAIALVACVGSTHSVQRRLRVGRVVGLQTPTHFADLVRCVKRGAYPIANGWSFWLGRCICPPHSMILANNWSGVWDLSDCLVGVKTGTTFGELRRHLKRNGVALRDRSQSDDLSVGGAVRTQAHGWCRKSTFSDALREMTAVRRFTGELKTVRRGGALFHEICRSEEWVLLFVVLETTPDKYMRVTRQTTTTPGFDSLAEYQMIAVTGRRIWSTTASSCAGRSEGMLSRLRTKAFTFGRLDNVLLLLGCKRVQTATHHLSDIHAVFKTMWPIETAFIRILGYRNAELFSYEIPNLQVLTRELQLFHRRYGGLSELRNSDSRLAIDVAAPFFTEDKQRIYWTMLRDCGVRRVHLHTGKWCPESISPLVRRPV